MLYNTNQKEEFINSISNSESSKKEYTTIFSRIGEVEELYDKDLCFMNDRDQLMEAASCIAGNRNASTQWKLRMLQRYVEWCAERFDGVSDEINNITAEDVNAIYIKNHMVSDPEDLTACLDSFLQPSEENTLDEIYKCLFWMAFAGIEKELTTNIKTSDVDLSILKDHFLIIHDRKQYEVPAIARKSFDICINSVAFKYINQNYTTGSIYRKRVDGDVLLRGVKASAQTYKRLMDKILIKMQNNNCKRHISYRSVELSGFFWRLSLRGDRVDFITTAKELISDREYKLDKSKTRATREGIELKAARDLQYDFNLWKKTFKKI